MGWFMQFLYATQVASISELKKNPSKLINDSEGSPIAILNHNTAAAYLVPVELFEKMMEMLDEHELENIVSKRLSDKSKPVKVNLDDL